MCVCKMSLSAAVFFILTTTHFIDFLPKNEQLLLVYVVGMLSVVRN